MLYSKLISIVALILILIPLATAATNMSEKNPTEIGNTFLGWLIEWFMVILKIAVVLGAIYYVVGFGNPESKARGTRLIQAVLIALVIFYALPWLITAISKI